MNKKLLEMILKKQKKENKRIRNLACYADVTEQFRLEYDIAKKLFNAREKANLTQKEIAKRMGTTQSVISRMENGYNVSIVTLEKYAKACDKRLQINII